MRRRNTKQEIVDLFADVQEGNIIAVSKATTLLLGKEQKKLLYDHLRTEKGNVPAEAFAEELQDIFESLGKEGKN